jgi:hypothetical protein
MPPRNWGPGSSFADRSACQRGLAPPSRRRHEAEVLPAVPGPDRQTSASRAFALRAACSLRWLVAHVVSSLPAEAPTKGAWHRLRDAGMKPGSCQRCLAPTGKRRHRERSRCARRDRFAGGEAAVAAVGGRRSRIPSRRVGLVRFSNSKCARGGGRERHSRRAGFCAEELCRSALR